MPNFILNLQPQKNGDFEVHQNTCLYAPITNTHYLGEFSNCITAVEKAKQIHKNSNGCYYCCNRCHTS